MSYVIDREPPLIGYIDRLPLSYTSAASVTIGAGTCRDSTGVYTITNASNRVANITSSGAGGLDTGSEAASTWYAVFIIADSAGVNVEAAMLSLSDTAPTMPSGYNIFRRVGWIRNNGSSDIINFFSNGNQRTRSVIYDVNKSVTSVLSTGTAITFTDIVLTSFVPPGVTEVRAFIDTFLKDAGDYVAFRPDGSAVTFAGTPWRFLSGTGERTNITVNLIASTGRIVEYRLSFADCDLNMSVAGYTDYI